MNSNLAASSQEIQRFAVIMAGGRGERFWPQSRTARPKHLLPIVGNKAMLVQTVDRLEGLVAPERIFILTNQQQRAAVLELCPQIPPAQIVAEPVGRDTAPAVGLAKILVKQQSPNASFVMLPADHVIHDSAAFQRVLANAFSVAESDDVLATIGIEPSLPETGYGYIHKGEALRTLNDKPLFRVQQFVEKPDYETACQYLSSGEYFWNAGMFIWSVASIEKAFASHASDLAAQLDAMEQKLNAGQSLDAVLASDFPRLTKISIDYAVIEKATNVVTLKSEFDWDDVGAWSAVSKHFPQDSAENTLIGEGLIQDSRGNLVVGSQQHLTTLIGVDDLIVVHTPEATLICHKSKAQDVKKLVASVAENPQWKHLL